MNRQNRATRNRNIALYVMLLMMTTSAFVQLAPAQPAPVESDERARLKALREQGFAALYNLDYAGARRMFREINTKFPDHPAGAQLLAMCVMLETLNKERRLQTSLYNDDSFYAEENDKPDPNAVREFRELTKRATDLAEARLQRNPKDAEALYFLGATRGLKAAFAGAVERRFRAALSDGRAAVEAHRDAIKIEPQLHDAELTIGLYDYVVGDLPLPVKLLASIGGVRGSKKRGLATLERVVREGDFESDNARVMLIALYRREKRPLEAVTQARTLAERYPRNFYFKLETADALMAYAAMPVNVKANNVTSDVATKQLTATEARAEALAIFDALINDKTSGRDAMMQLDLLRFKYGEALMQANEPQRAAQEFLRAAIERDAESSLATNAYLRAAQAFDLAGNRDEALKNYGKVLTLPNAYEAHAKARRGLNEKYKMPKTVTDEE